MLYRCVTRCFWDKRVYDEGEEYEIDPKLKPPKHFVLSSELKRPEPSKKVIDPMKPMPMSFGKPIIAKGGFAAKLDEGVQGMVDTIQKTVKPRGRPRGKA